MSLPASLQELVDQFRKLPGIGAKSAQRLAFHILKSPREDVERLAEVMREVKERVSYCSVCNNITDTDPCFFCTNPGRDRRQICANAVLKSLSRPSVAKTATPSLRLSSVSRWASIIAQTPIRESCPAAKHSA